MLEPFKTPEADLLGEKLKGLRGLLIDQETKANGATKKLDESGELLSFSEALFHRAPSEFLKSITLRQMSNISRHAFSLFSQFLKSSSPYLVDVRTSFGNDGETREGSVICSVMGDRPFIVDSLAEYFRSQGLSSHVMLHPILRDRFGKRISVTYTEIDPIQDPALQQKMSVDLGGVLADLILVADDFSPMLVRVETAARQIESAPLETRAPGEDYRETAEFLRWLADGGFVFYGHREWRVQGSSSLSPVVGSDLGLFRSENSQLSMSLSEIERDVHHIISGKPLLSFAKILLLSTIHSRTRMEVVVVKTGTSSGDIQVQCFLGLMTSKSSGQDVPSVPILRRKLQALLEFEGLIPNSHDYKQVVTIIDSIPKNELLQLSLQDLVIVVRTVLSIEHRKETLITLHYDPLRRSIFLMVVMPRERFSDNVRHKIQEHIEQVFGLSSGACQYRHAGTDQLLVRIHFLLPNATYCELPLDVTALEKQISELTLTWDDKLCRLLSTQYNEASALRLLSFYGRGFPEQYKVATAPGEAILDIAHLEALSEKNPLEISVRAVEEEAEIFDVKLYQHHGALTLSAILPYLENAGLNILSEMVTSVNQHAQLWATVYRFRVQTKSKKPLSLDASAFIQGLKEIVSGRAENDMLNALLLDPGMSFREIAIVRAFAAYLWQIRAFPSRRSILSAIVRYPTLARTVVQYFETKFNPVLHFSHHSEREAAFAAVLERFHREMKIVSNLMDDRIFRAIVTVLEATVRTNFYCQQGDLRVGLKISCKKVPQLPKPRPLFEIFVNAPDFEGVHLRGGMVARGGLRWSDRLEDYRTEVLGLMKTQMVKNSIIIPVGAKGGFVVKNRPEDPKALQESVRTCYSRFVSTLLELSDNRVGDSIQTPKDVIVYDDDDTYLVVAADKGTATFSDLANSVAVEKFNFWLGDAFASGGSNGYDHKKYAITAKGAWEAAKRHFTEVGIDLETQPFTVVGIGDLSGDVFGNGLTLIKNASLVAAFNHRHIFIDPNPDIEKSYQERLRMFSLPTSQWTDYRREALSPGGEILDRAAKEITISPEAQKTLGVTQEMLSGEELIKAILRAPVDMLFNGGIGTYVKASTEVNLFVGDPTNDDVRIDASELRARTVCEGGNLGFTQLGRVEFSRLGGHINTDAIDNSGGVDLSDHEVNLKILLQGPIQDGLLTLEDRNKLLLEYSSDVVRKVIARNRSQSKVLSLGVHRSKRNINYYRALINDLESSGLLDRKGEYLPDDEDLLRRSQLKQGLSRPELAILIAHVKMWVFNTLMKSNLTSEPFLQRYLFHYFPRGIVQRFPEHTAKHPLANEIIATQVANTLVEQMGATFLYRLGEETGATHTDVIFALLAATEIVGMREMRDKLRILDTPRTGSSYLKALLHLTSAIDNVTRWILDHRNTNLTWSEFIDRYRNPCKLLLSNVTSTLAENELRRHEETCRQLIAEGLPADLARDVAGVVYATAFLDIVDVATESARELTKVSRVYGYLAEEFHITRLLAQVQDIEPIDRWEALATRSITSELRDSVRLLTRCVLQETKDTSVDCAKRYLEERHESVKRYQQSLREFQNRSMTIAALLVITNQLYGLSRRIESAS